KIGKTANTMKSMLNSVNIAAPILHGLPLSSHPLIYTKAAANMIKFMANKDTYNAAMTAIEERPNYVPWRDAGLFVAKPESITASEEDFARSYVGFIPGVRDIIAVSKRGYTGFLNELRSKVADQLEKNAKDQGLDVFESVKLKDKKGNFVTDEKGNVKTEKRPTEIARNIAKYINNATDRGSLGKLEKIAPELNYLLWSPRRLTARATMLNPAFYYKLDAFSRREALKSLFAQAAIGTSMVSLGVLAGGKTSLDPSNPDFGKVRFGSHTLNPLGPTQSLVVAASKAIKELHRMGSGEKAKFGEQNIAEIAGGLIRNRESPIVRLADEIATAKQFTDDSKDKDKGSLEHGGFVNRFGDKKYISNEVRNSFTPIFIQDVEDLLKTDQSFAESIGLGAASFIGVSEQNSPIRKKKGLSLGRMRTLSAK
ncbi:MAG TPA: hypothetical protein VNX68_11305, partial [Nitrosopumilaceae archaeon]|nr:hypothetical protein [Nitrosopumilaceae archaeon]